ncbi:MAG: hypothetical protein EOO73_25120 [Myxococcales bacterium]|nr:MAG: hypothetical protein EOO73_25120 [Myxococcales bacterium]
MSDLDKSGAGAGQPPREVPIDWEALEDAFENNAPEVHSYLHLSTGEVLRVVDGIADPEMHQRIASDASYMRIEPVSSREQYRWMERFIPMVEDKPLSDLLTQAIDGKGAFRRFKDVLMSHGAERERWFAFRSERLRVFMEAWLAAHALKPTPRVVWPTEPATPKEGREKEAVASGPEAARRTRNIDTLRKQLHELVETLSARDLDKVIAFAEFVKARRAARGFAARESVSDSSIESDPSASPAPLPPQVSADEAAATDSPVPAAEDEATPSSRKRPAAR